MPSYVTASRYGLFTAIFAVVTFLWMIALFGVGIAQSGQKEMACNSTGGACASLACTDPFVSLVKPFQVTVFKDNVQVGGVLCAVLRL